MPLAIATAVILAIILPGLYFWHSYQIARNSVSLLLRAEQFEARQAWGEAAQCLYQYLKLRPDEGEARVRLATNFGAAAKTAAEKARAVQLYAAAIGTAPDQVELLHRQMTLLLELSDYSAALERAEELLKNNPENPAALRVRALAQHEAGRFKGSRQPSELAAAFEEAIARNPSDVVLADQLARLYRNRLQEPTKADEVLERLVVSSENKSEALLTRYRFRKAFGLPEADSDLDAAVAGDAGQKHLPTQLLAGERAIGRSQWESAETHLQAVIENAPSDSRGYLLLGEVHSRQGDVRRALEIWDRGLTGTGGKDLNLQFRSASAQVQLGDLPAAEKILNQLDKLLSPLAGPDQSDRLSLLKVLRADIAIQRKDYLAAVTLLNRALVQGDAGAETPEKVDRKTEVLYRLGQCYSQLEQWDQAVLALERATVLQPNSIRGRLRAARAWEMTTRLDEALRHYEAAIQRHEEGASGDEELPVSAYESYCDIAFRQQRLLPPGQRNWDRFQAAYTKAQSNAPDSVLLQLVGAEYEALQGNQSFARQLLEEVQDAAMKDSSLFRRLMFDFEQFGSPQNAEGLIKQLREADARDVQPWLLEAELLARRGEFAAAVQQLRLALSLLPAEKHAEINSALAVLYVAHGKGKEGARNCKSWQPARPLIERFAPSSS